MIVNGRDKIIVATEPTVLIFRVGCSTPWPEGKDPTGTRGTSNSSTLNPLQEVAAPLVLARGSRDCLPVTWMAMAEGGVR